MAMTVALNTFTRCNMFGNLSLLYLGFAPRQRPWPKLLTGAYGV